MSRAKAVMLAAVLAASSVIVTAGERVVVDAILVRVNDRIVTISDFQDRLLQELSQQPDRPAGAELKRFAEGLFEATVDELILLERAQEKRVTVDDEMVDRSIETLREDNDLQEEEAFEQALASAGMTVEDLRDRYRQNITLHRLVSSEVQPVEITEEELRQKYEKEKERFKVPPKVELEQLFFETEVEDGEDAGPDPAKVRELGRRISALVERVRGGADLTAEATLAGSEVQRLGAIPERDLRSELLEVLAGLDEGGITDPLFTAGGYQVLRLVRRIPAGYQAFEDVREQLRRELSQERYQDQSQGLVNRLKQEYLVEVHRDLIDQALAGAAGDG